MDYDPRWPGRFLAEAARVSRVLGDCVVAIHHIGSTAVPNLCAKPVIDILVQVSSLSIFDRQSKVLRPLGYESRGEYGLSGRRFFRKEMRSVLTTFMSMQRTTQSPCGTYIFVII